MWCQGNREAEHREGDKVHRNQWHPAATLSASDRNRPYRLRAAVRAMSPMRHQAKNHIMSGKGSGGIEPHQAAPSGDPVFLDFCSCFVC